MKEEQTQSSEALQGKAHSKKGNLGQIEFDVKQVNLEAKEKQSQKRLTV